MMILIGVGSLSVVLGIINAINAANSISTIYNINTFIFPGLVLFGLGSIVLEIRNLKGEE